MRKYFQRIFAEYTLESFERIFFRTLRNINKNIDFHIQVLEEIVNSVNNLRHSSEMNQKQCQACHIKDIE